MKPFFNALLFAAVMISAVSCTSEIELGDGVPSDQQGHLDIVLNLRTPGTFATPRTRSLSYADENTLSDVYVLVFDNATPSKLVSIKKADEVTDKTTGTGAMTFPAGGYSGGGAFSVALPPSGAGVTSNLVVLANAGDILHACGFIDKANPATASPKIGESYDTVIAAIRGEISGPMYPASSGQTIPMWAETGQIAITTSSQPDIRLMRAVARIDVGLGDEPNYDKDADPAYTWDGKDAHGNAIPFKMTAVYVVKANRSYLVVPARGNRSGNSVTDPSVPATPEKFPASNNTEARAFTYMVSNNLYTTQSIYVPEADILMGGTESGDANHTGRMALVVGGRYNGSSETTYYRLDFANDGTLMDVLRNHLYQFNISAVTGKGYASVIEAYESDAMNMEVKVLDLNETEMEYVVFDNTYYLGISRPEVLLDGDGETTTVTIRTNVPGFTMNAFGGDVDLVGNDSSKQSYTNGGMTYTLSGPIDGDTYTLRITAAKNYATNSRTHNWTIVAKRLDMSFEVIQMPTPDGTPLAAPGVIGYIKGTNTLTLKGSKEYAAVPEIKAYAEATFGGLEQETVFIAYFKFGSLVAVGNDPTDDRTDNSNTPDPSLDFTSDGILAVPPEWKSLAAARADIGNNWSAIPAYSSTDWQTVSKRNVSDPSYQDPSTAKGDPCIYYFSGAHGGGWRLPVGGSSSETEEPGKTNGGWNKGTFGFSTNSDSFTWFAATADGTRVPAGIRAGIDGDSVYPADWSMFLSTTGYLFHSTGSISGQKHTGSYWTSTARYSEGYSLLFDENRVFPASFGPAKHGHAIRCVRDL